MSDTDYKQFIVIDQDVIILFPEYSEQIPKTVDKDCPEPIPLFGKTEEMVCEGVFND